MENDSTNYSELGRKVLLEYNITPQDLKTLQSKGLKTLWKFTYKGTTLCLKRLKHTMEEALFSVNAQIYILNNGGKVPKIHLNSKGSPITEFNQQLFVLYSWVDGRDMNLENPRDLALALQALSRFHTDSVGYEPPSTAIVSTKLGKWPNQYESMKNRMLKIKELCMQNPNNPSYSTYINLVDPIIEMCNKTIILINNSPYGSLCSINQKESCLCHQDFGTGNVMLSKEGSTVIDLDGVTYDLPIRDLRKIIGKRMMKSQNYNINTFESILKYYETNTILSLEQKEVLKIDLMFPHWFFGLVKTLHKNPKPIGSDKISSVSRFELNKFSILKTWL